MAGQPDTPHCLGTREDHSVGGIRQITASYFDFCLVCDDLSAKRLRPAQLSSPASRAIIKAGPKMVVRVSKARKPAFS